MKYLILIVPTLALFGCPLDREKYDRTPAGWHVHWEEQGTLTTGLHSKLELYQLFDAAMERGIEEVHTGWGFDPVQVRAKLRQNDALYTIVDNFYFPVQGKAVDAPDAKYASGETFNRNEVTVAFYNRDDAGAVDPVDVPAESPAWTLKDSTSYPGKVYYGMEYDGRQYPALGYELHWQFTEVP